jgi:hypothetical protein
MHLPSLLARWFRLRRTPHSLTKTAHGGTVGCRSKAGAFVDRSSAVDQAEDQFQRRFRQLVAGGWSFRAAIAVAFVESTISSAASHGQEAPIAPVTNGRREPVPSHCGT